MTRPDPVALAEVLRDAAADYRDLRHDLAAGGGAGTDRITGGDEDRLPVNEALFDLLWAVDAFAAHHARVLYNESHDWRPPSKGGTPTMLEALALRIGHFTEHPDAQIAHEFADELTERSGPKGNLPGLATRLEMRARPSGKRPLPLGVQCVEDDCDGEYRIILEIAGDPLPEAMIAERIKGKDAWCSKHRHHIMRVGLMPAVRRWETLREVMG